MRKWLFGFTFLFFFLGFALASNKNLSWSQIVIKIRTDHINVSLEEQKPRQECYFIGILSNWTDNWHIDSMKTPVRRSILQYPQVS